mmetsp:Transcript_60200/g.155014  ORF Transcript_60200/g.155014 Transcript_60200/m.155014 type:complete len:357 (+) Transcript_60200:266-1336(+)
MCVRHRDALDGRVLQRDLGEALGVHGDDLRGFNRQHAAHVLPVGPHGRLAAMRALLVQLLGGLLLHEHPVAQAAPPQEEHLVVLVPKVEDWVVMAQGVDRSGVQANAADRALAHVGVQPEEEVTAHGAAKGEGEQLDLQRLREHPQQLHVGLLHALVLRLQLVLRVADDAEGERRRHLARAQEAPEQAHVLVEHRAHLPKLGHGGRDAGDERGEDQHRQDQDGNGKATLVLVRGEDLHGGWRELRERPVQRREVLVRNIVDLVEMVDVDPAAEGSLLLGGDADQVPGAGDDVVDAQQNQNELPDVEEDVDEHGVNAVHEGLHDALQLDEAQQPDGPEHAQDAQRLAHACDANLARR